MPSSTRSHLTFALGLNIALLVAACGAGDRTRPVTAVRDSAGIVIVQNHPDRSTDSCAISPAARVDIGVAQGAPEYQLYRVQSGTILSDGRIAIVNQGTDEIRVYDANGRFLYAFGRAGDGPGEFRNVFLIWSIGEDTLVVADYRPWRFSFFTAGGEFIRSVQPDPLYSNTPETVGLMSDGSFILGRESWAGEEPGFNMQHVTLVRHDKTGATLDTIGVYNSRRIGILSRELRFMGSPIFEPRTSIVAAGERIVIARRGRPELAVLNSAGRLQRLIRWSTGDRTVTSDEVDTYRNSILALYGDSGIQRRIAEARVSDDRPVNDIFPANGTVRIDQAWRLWVQRYPRPSWPDDLRWWVFGRDGRFLCHLVIPPMDTWDILEIGRDYLLTVQRDELDIEHVRIFNIEVS